MRRSIAIDPGYERVGVALFEGNTLVHSACITTSKSDTLSTRLFTVAEALRPLIKEFSPASMALETLYFSVNAKSALKVAEARGVIQLLAAEAYIPVFEYSPQAVKIAVTGIGNADKVAVERMVRMLVKLPHTKQIDDEIDAIALGIAHASSHRTISTRD